MKVRNRSLSAILVCVLALAASLVGCEANGDDADGDEEAVSRAERVCDVGAEVEAQVQELLAQMTLREKVDEMSGPPFSLRGVISLLTRPHDLGANERRWGAVGG